MGQHLSNINSQIVDWTNEKEAVSSSDYMQYETIKENINLFLSMKTFAAAITNQTEYHINDQILNSENLLTKEIQSNLLKLTKADAPTWTNTKVNKLLTENYFIPVADRYQKASQEIR
ncbi:unnamed protein product, partial [Rotaria magnacalcarata]